jgi:hypothetical protein
MNKEAVPMKVCGQGRGSNGRRADGGREPRRGDRLRGPSARTPPPSSVDGISANLRDRRKEKHAQVLQSIDPANEIVETAWNSLALRATPPAPAALPSPQAGRAKCMLEQPKFLGTPLPLLQFLRRMHALSPQAGRAKRMLEQPKFLGTPLPLLQFLRGACTLSPRLRGEMPAGQSGVSSGKHPTLPDHRATILGPFLTRDRFLDSSPDTAQP